MNHSVMGFMVSRSERGLGKAVQRMRMHTYGCKDRRAGVSCSLPTPAAIEAVISNSKGEGESTYIVR